MSNIDIVIKIVSLIFMSSVAVFVVYFLIDDVRRKIKSRQRQVEYTTDISWRNEILSRIHVLESDVRSTSETLETQIDERLKDLEENVQYLQSGIFSEAFESGPVSLDAIRLDLLKRITVLERHIFPNDPEKQVKFNVADLEKRVKALEKKVKPDE